ncbi:M42 family metallopeptidase [Thermoactinomyces sp. DSM 45892]|uniref:M42 family metallopeptidase n=1 Tax=Thermoactinomyces sp. DSM 45892 TaxID=1882753 RepID=UPI0008966B09|nr:M42 family metallopeptidase [Thermoactinomyces sp. DSM 45892]SDY27910.1 Putative aminopeptidase FrvX [Thermoactinomyces sp. DSM 45892]
MTTPIDQIVSTIKDLVHIPSPTGWPTSAIDYVEKRWKQTHWEMKRNAKGALTLTIPGKDQEVHRFVTAHVDTLGAMVKEIRSDGKLALMKIGGFGWFAIDGVYCTVHTEDGKEIRGTILATNPSVHVNPEADTKREQHTMAVRLDVKVQSKEDVEQLGIQVGDFITFDPNYEELETGFIKTRHLDDKASVAVLIELVLEMKKQGIVLPHTTHIQIGTFEEVGFGANSNIPAQVREFLAVDMGAIGEGQSTDEFTVSICAMDGVGPYNYELRRKLVKLAKEYKIPYQIDLYPFYGSDAGAALKAGEDVMHALIGPGVDASHAFERTHRDSLQATYQLLNKYLETESL